jgi:hypothetical protein
LACRVVEEPDEVEPMLAEPAYHALLVALGEAIELRGLESGDHVFGEADQHFASDPLADPVCQTVQKARHLGV